MWRNEKDTKQEETVTLIKEADMERLLRAFPESPSPQLLASLRTYFFNLPFKNSSVVQAVSQTSSLLEIRNI